MTGETGRLGGRRACHTHARPGGGWYDEFLLPSHDPIRCDTPAARMVRAIMDRLHNVGTARCTRAGDGRDHGIFGLVGFGEGKKKN